MKSDYWKENGLIKPPSVIVSAAVRFPESGLIVCGVRHFDKLMVDVITLLREGGVLKEKSVYADQGFVNQFGEFLTREEALKIAVENDQIDWDRNGSNNELFSEGLY